MTATATATAYARRRATPQEFQKWCETHVMMARALRLTRIHAALTRQAVDAYVQPIFDSFTFEYDPRWAARLHKEGPITKMDDLYLADLASAPVRAFYAACDVAHRTHGFAGPAGHCPALIAEHEVITLENLFIDSAAPLFGIREIPNTADRDLYIEILLGGCEVAEGGR